MDSKLPKELTHYTTLSGLMGIVDNKTMWASSALFLNDKSELLHGFEAAKLAVKGNAAEAERRWIKAVIEELGEIENNGIADVFITCFCEHDDVLSLWRGYGGADQGVSVTFDAAKIAARLKREKSLPAKVIYAQVTTVKKFRDELKKEIEDLREWVDVAGDIDPNELKKDAQKLVAKLLPRFKHYGFRDEREFRFVVHRFDESEVRFRQKGSVIVPYVSISLGARPLPIKFVTIGPGTDMELTKKSVERYLRSKGYSDIEVRRSEVPFRP